MTTSNTANPCRRSAPDAITFAAAASAAITTAHKAAAVITANTANLCRRSAPNATTVTAALSSSSFAAAAAANGSTLSTGA
jgi:hypothetical protein